MPLKVVIREWALWRLFVFRVNKTLGVLSMLLSGGVEIEFMGGRRVNDFKIES
jgi:hypothetical protein